MSTSFKEFLLQEQTQLLEAVVRPWDAKAKDVKSAIELLNKHCKDGLKAISTGGILWRGWSDGKFALGSTSKLNGDVFLVDTTNSLRTSRDYDNLYMLLLDASKHFKDVPSRGRSLICSSNYHDADSYAGSNGPTAIIPFDGTKIAFIPKFSDFNSSQIKSKSARQLFLNGTFTDQAIPEFLSAVSKKVEVKGKGGSKYKAHVDHNAINLGMSRFSPEQLTLMFVLQAAYQGAEEVDSLISVPSKSKNRKEADRAVEKFQDANLRDLQNGKWLKDYSKTKFETMLQFILSKDAVFVNEAAHFYKIISKAPVNARFSAIASQVATPENLNIKTVTFGQKLPPRTECWVSGKFIVMSNAMFKKIIAELHELKHPISPEYKSLASTQIELLKRQKEKLAGKK